ncbi:hypothetical protein ACIBKY_18365 [Nonomuraea sp. NPDC050394]|uniref:hypothetical protein n=1 Tax=Nonomuraea sp. NPDC050394 TaxID=3364363 RepID=UPI0037A0530F
MSLRISRPAKGSGARRARLPRLAALALAGGAVLATAGAAHAAAPAPEPIELRLVLNDCPDDKVEP